MKSVAIVLVITLASLANACGAPETDPEPVLDPPEIEAAKNGHGGQCPTTLTCPASIPGYPTFIFAGNNCNGSISCCYRNAQFQQSCTVMHPAADCDTCCAPSYCPDQRCGQQTVSQSWSCDAP